MKKFYSIIMVLMMLGAIFGLSLHQTAAHIHDSVPVIAQALDFVTPAIAYADDTTGGKEPTPPPPPFD